MRLTQPDPGFPARTTLLCPVPLGLPVNPEGISAPFSGAGPYYVSSWVRGRGLTMKRNRFYSGASPRRVDRIRYVLVKDTELVPMIEQGRLDTHDGLPGWPPGTRELLARRYGVNRARFFMEPFGFLHYLAFNAERRLFRNNAPLRRAINYALDRRALAAAPGPYTNTPEEQYMPPVFPGLRRRVYPPRGNIKRARTLARGRTRTGKAVLYTRLGPAFTAAAQIITANLARIGIDVDVKQFPFSVFFEKLATPGEPFDIATASWIADFPDPAGYLNALLESRQIPDYNLARFRSRRYDRLLTNASRLQGAARYRAYGRLEHELRTKAAPWAPYMVTPLAVFISKRIDPRCVVIRFTLDLSAACLKR